MAQIWTDGRNRGMDFCDLIKAWYSGDKANRTIPDEFGKRLEEATG